MSTSKPCHLAQFSRTTFYRKTQAKDQSALRLRIREATGAISGLLGRRLDDARLPEGEGRDRIKEIPIQQP